MPELPEVETLRRTLEPRIVGRTIRAVEVRETRLRRPVEPAVLRRGAVDRRITAVGRRAKYLRIELEGPKALLVHLGMSGRVRICEAEEAMEPHTHVVLSLDDGREMRFRDPRRFGLFEAIDVRSAGEHVLLKDLGIEPLDQNFDGAWLHDATRGSKKPIKNFIMDAHVIVGVGNIYASESLFVAGISPGRSAGRLSRIECSRLALAVREVLEDAVRQGGTTLNDFQDADGQSGYFQVSLRVYDREDQPCPRCRTPIRRRVMGGRSTYHCPKCQK